MATGQAINTVPTAEELRLRALARAQSRGKWVAKRRLIMRETWHVLWTMVFPSLGLVLSLLAIFGLPWLWLSGTSVWNLAPNAISVPSGVPTSLQLDRDFSFSNSGAAPTASQPSQ